MQGPSAPAHVAPQLIQSQGVEGPEVWPSVLGAAAVLVLLGCIALLLPGIRGSSSEAIGLRAPIAGLIGVAILLGAMAAYLQLRMFRVRKRLSDAEKLFYVIGDNAADLIAIVDVEGRRLYNSPSYEKVLGYTLEELQTTSGLEQIHPDDRAKVAEAAEEARRTGSGRRLEYRIRHKSGSWRVLESMASAVRDSQGRIEKLIIMNRDITAQRELAEEVLRQKEDQLRQAQKMEAVGRLSGGVAHDFNNLLGVIIGYAEDLEQRLDPSDRLRKEAEEVRKAGERAASLTRQLLAFSRHQVLQPRVLDLNTVVADLAKMLCRVIGSDIELTLALDPRAGRVKADQAQIEQVVMNLVLNARDAMPDGGCLTVTTSAVQIAGESGSPTPHIQLTVSDTGIGMDEQVMAHIFEPFFTTKDQGKGTGLGLATVYGIVKQSGGQVTVRSQPGKGASFQILLPATQEAIASAGPEDRPAKPVSSRSTILLAEDDGALRELISSILERGGYRVLAAGTPGEARRMAAEFRGPIHLLVSDVILPGMKGPSLAKALLAARADMRVLYMSGASELDSQDRGAMPLDAPLLQKPFSRETLLRKVAEMLAVADVEVASER
jgi:PAS domain S-box-containing protein